MQPHQTSPVQGNPKIFANGRVRVTTLEEVEKPIVLGKKCVGFNGSKKNYDLAFEYDFRLNASQFPKGFRLNISTPPLRYVVLADIHLASANLVTLIKSIEAKQPHFIILAGDWVYERALTTAIIDQIQALFPSEFPIFVLAGNHEYGASRMDKIKRAAHAKPRKFMKRVINCLGENQQANAQSTQIDDVNTAQPEQRFQNVAEVVRYATDKGLMAGPYYTLDVYYKDQLLCHFWLVDTTLLPKDPYQQQFFHQDFETVQTNSATPLVVVGHHPFRSGLANPHKRHQDADQYHLYVHNGENYPRGIMSAVENWFTKYARHTALYICGHDHVMAMLYEPFSPTQQVIVGGGGYQLHRATQVLRPLVEYARRIQGFGAFELQDNTFTVRLWANGERLLAQCQVKHQAGETQVTPVEERMLAAQTGQDLQQDEALFYLLHELNYLLRSSIATTIKQPLNKLRDIVAQRCQSRLDAGRTLDWVKQSRYLLLAQKSVEVVNNLPMQISREGKKECILAYQKANTHSPGWLPLAKGAAFVANFSWVTLLMMVMLASAGFGAGLWQDLDDFVAEAEKTFDLHISKRLLAGIILSLVTGLMAASVSHRLVFRSRGLNEAVGSLAQALLQEVEPAPQQSSSRRYRRWRIFGSSAMRRDLEEGRDQGLMADAAEQAVFPEQSSRFRCC